LVKKKRLAKKYMDKFLGRARSDQLGGEDHKKIRHAEKRRGVRRQRRWSVRRTGGRSDQPHLGGWG